MPGIAMPAAKKDNPIDRIAAGLNMVRSVYGLKADMAAMEKYRRETDAFDQAKTANAPDSPLAVAMRAEMAGKPADTAKIGVGGLKEFAALKKQFRPSTGDARMARKEATIDKKDRQEITQNIDVIKQLESLKTRAPQYGEYIGPAADLVPNFARQGTFFGIGKAPAGYQKFQAGTGSTFDLYRKNITGAQASVKEIDILKKRFPSTSDTADAFLEKADEQIARAKAKLKERVETQLAMGKTVGLPPSAMAMIQGGPAVAQTPAQVPTTPALPAASAGAPAVAAPAQQRFTAVDLEAMKEAQKRIKLDPNDPVALQALSLFKSKGM